MVTRNLLTRLGLSLSIAANLAVPSPSPARGNQAPNIVFILADDLGYADLSSYGAQGYETPALDRLAAEGMRFEQAYANAAVCSPTRAALLTGRYQGRFRAGLNEPNIRFKPGEEIPASTPTVATLLKQRGYRTALIGKWHVTKVPEFGPRQYGYDHFFGIEGGAADYFQHVIVNQGRRGDGPFENETIVKRDGYLTDILADEAIRQIEAGGPQPLFLSLHFTAPHWPWEGPDDRNRALQLNDMRDASGGSLAIYAEMMKNLDANIGRVLAALDKAGMADNTIVVFTSDNGGERFSNSWPLVGYKGELLEGGIRVPMIVRWPGRIQPGTLSQQVTISMDSVPTFVEAAGGNPPNAMDGISILPQLTGKAPPVQRTLFWRYKSGEQAAVREGDWKYLRIGNKEQLFNLAADVRERAELKEIHPDIFARLKSKWEEWNADMLPYTPDIFSEGALPFFSDRYVQPESGKDGH